MVRHVSVHNENEVSSGMLDSMGVGASKPKLCASVSQNLANQKNKSKTKKQNKNKIEIQKF